MQLFSDEELQSFLSIPVRGFTRENSRPFNAWRKSHSGNIDKVITVIIDNMKHNGYLMTSKKEAAYRIVYKRIILDLFIAYSQDKSMTVHIGRADSNYSNGTEYHQAGLRYTSTINVIEHLWNMGLIHMSRGQHDSPEGKELNRGTMAAESKLIDLIRATGLSPKEIHIDKPEIILRDASGRVVEHKETRQVKQWKANVKAINEHISKTDVTLDLTELERAALLTERGHLPDLTANRLYRVFKHDFAQGGRFYGHWIQGLSPELRGRVLIDGESIVELDFCNIHARLAYSIAGAAAPAGDLYQINDATPGQREIAKKALLLGFNADTPTRLCRAVANEFRKKHICLKWDQIREVIAGVSAKHKAIKGFIGSGIGLQLQFIDSQICEHVLLDLMSKEIVALPIHDSFLVQRRHENELHQAMNEASKRTIGVEIPIK
jgi:hypothetical protein